MTLVDGVYELGNESGSGSYGVVFEATDTETNQKVAVKFAHYGVEAKHYLEEEIENLLSLSKSIQTIGVVDYVKAGNDSTHGEYLVMEWLDYGINDIEWTIPTMLEIGEQLSIALESLHAQGMGHHDFHSGNWRMNKRGVVKLIDMSFAVDNGRQDEDFIGLANMLYLIAGMYINTKEAKALADEVSRNFNSAKETLSWDTILEMFQNFKVMFGGSPIDLIEAVKI